MTAFNSTNDSTTERLIARASPVSFVSLPSFRINRDAHVTCPRHAYISPGWLSILRGHQSNSPEAPPVTGLIRGLRARAAINHLFNLSFAIVDSVDQSFGVLIKNQTWEWAICFEPAIKILSCKSILEIYVSSVCTLHYTVRKVKAVKKGALSLSVNQDHGAYLSSRQ